MSDEVETPEVDQENEDLYALLGVTPPEDDDEMDELEQEQDEEIAKANKIEKKLTAKMTDMQKKFDNTILKERIGKFQETASPLEKDLFKTVASDVKRPEDLDEALGLVRKQAKQLEEKTEEYKKQMEETAAQEAARAWGTAPVGTPAPKTVDYEEELMKKIDSGDTHALLVDLIGDDAPWMK